MWVKDAKHNKTEEFKSERSLHGVTNGKFIIFLQLDKTDNTHTQKDLRRKDDDGRWISLKLIHVSQI